MYRSASGTYLMTGTMINNDKQPNIMGKAMACELADIVGYGEKLGARCVGVSVVLGTFALHPQRREANPYVGDDRGKGESCNSLMSAVIQNFCGFERRKRV